MVQEIRRVAVIGAGLMGHGIAQEMATAGLKVALHDVSQERLDAARANIGRNLGTLGVRDAAAVLARTRTGTMLREVAEDADLVIEAISEDLEAKRKLFAELDGICPPRTIFASNSSSLMPSRMAAAVKRPDRLLVAHYFNPPYLVPLVEIVRGPETSDETVATVHALMLRIGKTPVVLRKEVPGFIANRIQAALSRECLSLVERGIATPEEVDAVVRGSIGRRLAAAGPFEIFDAAGADVWQSIGKQVLPDIDASREVSPLVNGLVERGELGIKSGKGFYEWTPQRAQELRERMARALREIRGWEEGKL
ncbi:MAG: 3-hydroxyacyl-CoA dehydrogenase family protein [SAR202 cluster bacterium]|nr:3-hydroxyacyl-CoA dehydrogenase family protein [SAR202 cluster bacterium]